MRATWAIFICLTLSLLVACATSRSQSKTADRAILRLEYREYAKHLPPMRLDGVQLQESSRLGRMSPVVWHYQEKELGRDFFLPLPESYELQDRMHESLSKTLEAFGFALRGWPGDPQVLVGVNVKHLYLRSLGLDEGYRSCALELEFILREAPSGLEITRFLARGETRLEGSWTHIFRDGPRWQPTGGEANPVLEATQEAVLEFLDQSREFWRNPDSWKATVHFSEAGR